MNVCGAPLGVDHTARISSSGASAFCFGPTRKSRSGSRRSPRRLASSTSAPSTSSGGSASPAGDAVPRLPPIVPRFRICGEPTVREASASAGSSPASGDSIASVYVSAAPSRSAPFSRDQPLSSATSFRFRIAEGRARSKLSSTITSVPPSIGTASGRSAFTAQRLVERARSQHVHASRLTLVRFACNARPCADASPSPAATSPPTSSSAAAASSPSSRASGSRPTSRSSTAAIAGLGDYEGARDARRDRPLRRARLHRRAHAPRVVEAARRRVRAARAAARDDRRRRRPARDRQRARHGRRALARRPLRGPAARRLLHGLVVRAGLGVRVAAPAASRPATSRGCSAAGGCSGSPR